ncbi:MAG: NifU family protein [Acidimicrobiales bacterium]
MASLLSVEERGEREAALGELMNLMADAVRADGGDLVLVDVDYDAGIVEVRLEGACGSCAISGMTLQGGVERLLRSRLDWVTEVRGSVDESMDFFESASLGRGAYVKKEG